MWTPKTSSGSNSNSDDVNRRTHLTPFTPPFVTSRSISNEFGNDKRFDRSIPQDFGTPYFPATNTSRSSTIIANLPSAMQKNEGGSSSIRNRSEVLTINQPSQLSIRNSHGYSDFTRPHGQTFIPNKLPLVPNQGHTGQMVNSVGSFVSADGSGSSCSGLANVQTLSSGSNLSTSYTGHNLGNSGDMAPLTFSETQSLHGTEHFSYMRLLNDSSSDDDTNIGVNDLRHPCTYYCSVDDPQGQPGLKRMNDFSFFQQNQYSDIAREDFSLWSPYQGFRNIEDVIDYSVTQRQKEHFVRPQQYIEYQLFKQPQPQPSLYNPRGKEAAPGDDYGLLSLLRTVKGANPTEKALALGVDPLSLGLDLTSREPLHPKFASPWSYEPVEEGPKFEIPGCYNYQQPPPLKRLQFKKFHLPTLFYIFYSMPQDQAQLLAANELHDRGWYFHKVLQTWFTRDNASGPTMKNEAYEIGSYIFFDPETWKMIRQENIVLYYRMIEQRSEIPL